MEVGQVEGSKMVGHQSVAFHNPPYILSEASVAGKKEGEGPLGSYFDLIDDTSMFGAKSWEEAESHMQKRAADIALEKCGLKPEEIRYLVAGDLLGQLIATSFGIMNLNIPMFGVYGACSTMGESMAIGAMLVDGGYADTVLAMTSSHFASAEKQFRFPLSYGNQRPLAATWTVTGSGAVTLSQKPAKAKRTQVRITGITTGRITDYGIKDSMNMGACMAPAAADAILGNLEDFGRKGDYYDKIITGDLGCIGKDILLDILRAKDYLIEKIYLDCGLIVYDQQSQDTHAGGSGCGCSAITLTSYIMQKMRKREWKKVLFVPTGALLSTVSFNEGNTVPGIAHAIVLEVE